ncbi:unnamed protein product [Hermetia illucens]|uniref:phospholipase A2 n=1 Tax=Hermetia illucens TaxID=343691 RepID=A0A7R8UWI1_HERIL|nr:unnamed protein product [Hermetia illucens]
MNNRVNLRLFFAIVVLMGSFWSCKGKSWTRSNEAENDYRTHSRRHSYLRHLEKDLDLPAWVYNESFILTDNLEDGEGERRISSEGIAAKETSVVHSNGKALSLLQISNGHGFIQLIYSSLGELVDCEYIRQKPLVIGFLRKFYDDVDVVRSRNFTSPQYKPRDEFYDLDEMTPAADAFSMRNLSYKRIKDKQDIPTDMRRWLNFNELKTTCTEKHRQMKQLVQKMSSIDENARKNATEHFNRKKRALSDWLIAPNTKWCGRGHNANKYSHLGGASRADKCCRKHDHCALHIPGLTTKWQLFNYRPFTLSHCKCDMRQRRDLASFLRVPGTKWCGKGWSATKYADLGGYSKTDRCCRQHDKSCPFWIMGFETKYGLFNWRINTLMHCKCDERFRTCLKMADSPDANLVGKLFFNIVQTKCFVLKPEKVCKRTSWWGKCEERSLRKRAHIRDNRQF